MNITTGKVLTDEELELYFNNEENVGIEIIGFGSLLSKVSSQTTFPDLTNFRVVRVVGYRRVFRHPASIFFERGIATMEDLRISSLSCEKHEGSSFLAVVFEVKSVKSGSSFQAREEEFDFHIVPYETYRRAGDRGDIGADINMDHRCNGNGNGNGIGAVAGGKALMCVSSTNESYIARWGQETFSKKYLSLGLGDRGIWGWEEDSGIFPCSVYLRHCYLSAKKLSASLGTTDILDSFLDDTYLVDRVTTVRVYLDANPCILDLQPPDNLVGRYSG